MKVFVLNRITEEEVYFTQMDIVERTGDEEPDEVFYIVSNCPLQDTNVTAPFLNMLIAY